jgi:hypothetical protein
MSRPQTLAEAAALSLAGNKPFGHAVDELLDEFYLHPDVRQARIDDAPVSTGDALHDAWLGAVGEHLARRWGLQVPAWAERPQHFRMTAPRFFPPSAALRGYLYFESPLAFRRRMIFTTPEPLQRARFPRTGVRDFAPEAVRRSNFAPG